MGLCKKNCFKFTGNSIVFLMLTLLSCVFYNVQAQVNVSKNNQLQEVKLQLKWKHQFQFAGYYVAQTKGFYAAENLKVDILQGGLNKSATDIVAANQAQYGIGDSEILLDFAKGKPFVVISALFQHSPYILLSRDDSHIQAPSDLIGKRVMLGDNQGAEEFKAIIKNEGIALGNINIVTHSWNLQDLIDRKVDAISAYITAEPNYLRAQGIKPGILHSTNYGVDFYGDTLFTTRQEVQTHPKRVDAFLRATQKGWAYALNHKAEVADLILNMDGVRERGITREILLNEARDMEPLILSDLIEIGHINPGHWQHIANELAKLGLVKQDLDLTGFIYQPIKPSPTFSKKTLLIASFLGLIALSILAIWTFKTRQRMRISAQKLKIETARRQQTEMELVEAQSRVNEMFKSTAAGIAIADTNGRYVMANNAYCEMLQYSESELKTTDFYALTPPEDRLNNAQKVQQLLDGEINSITVEKRHVKKDGEIIWVRASVTPMHSATGEITNIISVCENIDKQKALADKLKRSEELLQLASHLAHMGGWDLELKNRQMTWSDEVSILHDMQPGHSVTLEEASNMIAPQWRDLLKTSLDECIATGKPYDLEFQKVTAKNRSIWVRSVAQAVRNEAGEIVRIQGAFQDISNYKKLEIFNQKQSLILEKIASGVSLKAVLEQCVQLIENQYPTLICMVNLLDESGRYLKTGTSKSLPAEYVKAIDGVEIGPAVGSCGTAAFEQREVIVSDIATDALWQNYKQFALKHNLLACWSLPVFSSKGLVIGTFAAYSTQIATPLKEEIELIRSISKTIGIAIEKDKSSEQIRLLQSAISRLNDIVLITEAESINQTGPVTVFVNDAFEQRTGYRRDEIIGKSPRMLQGPKTDKVELKRIHDALENWQPVRAELINYKKNGEEFWIDLDIVPINNAAGLYTHWVAVERDITKRKATELETTRLNRALRMLSACNDRLVRIKDETQLIHEICQLAVEVGGYSMAWVGYAQHDAHKSIIPAGSFGSEGDFLNQLNLGWAENNPRGLGPGGKTIRGGKTITVDELAKDPTYPALKEATQEGYLSLVCLPLLNDGRCFGFLAMYKKVALNITTEELKLLEDMADDLSFGILSIRAKAEQERLQAAVMQVASSVSMTTNNQFFEQLVQNMVTASDADAGFIALLMPDEQLQARTTVAIADNKLIENFTYDVGSSPCNHLLRSEHFMLSNASVECFPSQTMLSLGMKDYIGQRLVNSRGKIIGMIFVMKRDIFKQDVFTVSTLKIFATRAAAEIERQDYDRHLSEQASLLDKAQDAIIVRDMDYRIRFWNKGAERLYGWTAEEALGQSIVDLTYLNPADFFESDEKLLKTGEYSNEVIQKRKDKTRLFAEVRWSLVKDDKGQPLSVLCINTDITQRKAAAEEIQYMAFYDALTNLPNRLLLQERLKHALTSSIRNNRYGAILFIDIDNFKTINDTMGHAAGDILLQNIAKRLLENIRDSDTVSRLGGDEFIIMLEELSTDLTEAAVQTKLVGEKLIQLFQEPFDVGNQKYYSSPSIGITLFKDDNQSVTDLLKQADLAMYQAKAAGRNALRFYDPQMQATVSRRVEIEADLRDALKNNEFLLHYQPQMDSAGQCIGAEALLRWNNAIKGMISPAQFIPLAEETRLILPIGEWVLKTACEALVKWEKMPEMANLQLAVNVSVHQFRLTNFVEQVLAIVQSTGANPARLKLELTESLFVENVEDIIAKMTALKAQGIAFSLDDFGTGYSSLSYLKRLPLDQLKIDQSFIRDVLTDTHDATIARSIITLGQNLGLAVIAEGVELLEQKEFLLSEGCHFYQGYYFSRPLPMSELENFIKNKKIHQK